MYSQSGSDVQQQQKGKQMKKLMSPFEFLAFIVRVQINAFMAICSRPMPPAKRVGFILGVLVALPLLLPFQLVWTVMLAIACINKKLRCRLHELDAVLRDAQGRAQLAAYYHGMF